jgi:hypothetical protein
VSAALAYFKTDHDKKAKLNLHQQNLKITIAGDDILDVWEFEKLTAEHGWPQGLILAWQNLESDIQRAPSNNEMERLSS